VDRFLKAKHWQLFLLTFGLPFVLQMVVMIGVFSSMASGGVDNIATMFRYFSLFPVIMIVFAGVLYGWYWSVGVGLQKKVPENIKMKVGRFKVFFFIPLVYILFFTLLFGLLFSRLIDIGAFIEEGSGEPPIALFSMFGIIFPLHLFSMFCMFYNLYFVAKTIKTAELQRRVEFSDFVGEFFLTWFYPIGIWILQPKINKMVESGEGEWL